MPPNFFSLFFDFFEEKEKKKYYTQIIFKIWLIFRNLPAEISHFEQDFCHKFCHNSVTNSVKNFLQIF